MADNNFNYSNPTLAGGGFVEHAVREGLINDPDGTHQPRTGGMALTAEDVYERTVTEENAYDINKDFAYDKPSEAIWEKLTVTGREYIGYDRLYRYEFLPGNEKEAKAFKRELLTSGNNTFREEQTESMRTTFVMDKTRSDEKITELNLDIESLRAMYDETHDIADSLVDKDTTTEDRELALKVATMGIGDIIKERQSLEDLKLFSPDKSNHVKTMFGGDRTSGDVGFYIDKSDRIRATYDSFMIYRSKRLVDDLLATPDNNQYAVGYFPKTGSIQFVISKELSAMFIEKYGTLKQIATRWNDETIKPANFNPVTSGVFEQVINIETSALIDAVDIFGFTVETEEDEGKKSQPDDVNVQ